MKKVDKKTVILITVVLLVCLVVGISVGRYLFKITHPEANMISNLIW